MGTFFKKLWDSVGLKRRIASLLLVVAQLVQNFPELSVIVLWLDQIAAFFGVAGVSQAATEKTVKKYKSATMASILAAFVAAAHYFPVLIPYIGLIRTLAAMFGVVAITKPKK